MQFRARLSDYLAAISIVLAFGGLFFGRLMIYPVSRAPGNFLERVAAESQVWDHGHRVMLLGALCAIPAALALRRALGQRSPWLCDVGAALTIFGAALVVGQYALDFGMLAAAKIQPSGSDLQFVTLLESNAFTNLAFYVLPDAAQYGLILFAIALWRQGRAWRLQAALVTLAAATALFAPLALDAIGVRIGLGAWFVAFLTVAWKVAAGQPADSVQTRPAG